jgi:hypothetical protein
MRCLSIRLQAVAAVFAILVVLSSGAQARGESRSGLVVAYGDGRMAYVVVNFAGESISGAEVLDRSGLAVTEVSFGGLGVAVCAVDSTGCDVRECRQRLCHGPKPDDPYWQYFVALEGTWKVAPLGVSGDSLENGSVRAFIWSAGAPSFTVPSIDEIAGKAGAPGSDAVALTRYRADGAVEREVDSQSSKRGMLAGLAGIGLAVVLTAGLVLHRSRQVAA